MTVNLMAVLAVGLLSTTACSDGTNSASAATPATSSPSSVIFEASASTPTTAVVSSAPVDPEAVLAAFVPPDDLGIGYAPMLAGRSSPLSTDHPECAAAYTPLPGTAQDAWPHLELVYAGTAPSGIRSLDLFVVSDSEAEAAITTAARQPSTIAACQTAVLRTALGSPDLTTTLTRVGGLPPLPVESAWLELTTRAPLRDINLTFSRLYFRSGPLIVVASLGHPTGDNDVVALADELATSTANALRWVPAPTVMPPW